MQKNNNTKRKIFKQFSLEERKMLERLIKMGYKKTKIAELMGRNRSTISRQLKDKRNLLITNYHKSFKITYNAELADESYKQRKNNCGAKIKLYDCLPFIEHLENYVLNKKWAPKVAVGRLLLEKKFENVVTPKTIYNYIDRDLLKIKTKQKRKKTKRRIVRKNKTKLGKSIELREDIINTRARFGDYECDSVVDVKHNAILVTQERLSRYVILTKLEKHNSEEVLKNMQELHEIYEFKSMTTDNGSEFSKLSQLTESVYFTHPYSSWEKGSVENVNGIIRRYIPKGTNLKNITQQMLNRIQNEINNLPREKLKYKTAQEVFQELAQEGSQSSLNCTCSA